MVLQSLARMPSRQSSEPILQSVLLKGSKKITGNAKSFSTSNSLYSRNAKKIKPRIRDAYVIKQEEARRAANLARSAETKIRRAAVVGDPIRGSSLTTPFVQSFELAQDSISGTPYDTTPNMQSATKTDTLEEATVETSVKSEVESKPPNTPSTGEQLQPNSARPSRGVQLNHFFTVRDMQSSIDRSQKVLKPYMSVDRSETDLSRELEEQKEHSRLHTLRTEAINRILSTQNASSDQRTQINTQRCIEKFGRHNTDHELLSPQPQSIRTQQRAGRDTGSSEVQIAILTAKIRVLLAEYEGRSKNDKINKRNLRVLLHKRQKLLKYFERKDRGGPRWQHVIETLGLTPATWKGEINVK